MKAAQISEYGSADKITVVTTEKPLVGPGYVLVEVHAASLNPFDTMVREGYVKDMIAALPITLGGDIAGTVVEVGEGVTHVAVGDNVYGQANAVGGNSGAFAEFAVTKAVQIAKVPANSTLAEAASLPLVAASAYQALHEHISLQSGQKLFIHGGSGGIGSIAIQIAKHLNAYVAASARADGVELVKQLGANEVIDTESQDFVALVRDYDAVFDTVGGDDFGKCLSVLKPGGIAVSMVVAADETQASEQGIKAFMQSTKVTTDKLDAISDLVEQGVIKPQIAKIFSLDQIVEAFEAREGGQLNGKIVIQIK